MRCKSPFPWFGGKSKVSQLVWQKLGPNLPNYVEPFFGSGAVLLGRPGGAYGLETVNDLDGHVCNTWRAIQGAPDEVAEWADWPVNECDLHARHIWLKERGKSLPYNLMADPEYFDAKAAGWWLWGMAIWIGGGFCGEFGRGPWVVENEMLVAGQKSQGVTLRRPHLTGSRGIICSNRQSSTHHLDMLCDKCGMGKCGSLRWMQALAERMKHVRVCCGDWKRVLGRRAQPMSV